MNDSDEFAGSCKFHDECGGEEPTSELLPELPNVTRRGWHSLRRAFTGIESRERERGVPVDSPPSDPVQRRQSKEGHRLSVLGTERRARRRASARLRRERIGWPFPDRMDTTNGHQSMTIPEMKTPPSGVSRDGIRSYRAAREATSDSARTPCWLPPCGACLPSS
jgi:hypothetical protein